MHKWIVSNMAMMRNFEVISDKLCVDRTCALLKTIEWWWPWWLQWISMAENLCVMNDSFTRCARNCLFYYVLILLAYIHSVIMNPFVCLGIHFFFLFTDLLIDVYLLIYFLIYSVSFCLSGQAPSLLWHDRNHNFPVLATALSRPGLFQLRRRPIIHHCPLSSFP